MKTIQRELAATSDCFNLMGERGVNIDRIIAEQREQLAKEVAAKEFTERMQRTFEQCPGFIGGDVPQSFNGRGVIVVEPAKVGEALPWLKRRFHANENLELSADGGLAIEVQPRQPRKLVNGKRVNVTFAKPEQFQLALA